jgi:hypothetical protein
MIVFAIPFMAKITQYEQWLSPWPKTLWTRGSMSHTDGSQKWVTGPAQVCVG